MAEDLTANGEREVFFEMNGQLRSVFIKDKEAVKVCSEPGLNSKIWGQAFLPHIHEKYLHLYHLGAAHPSKG
jgi:pyruvate carboxylase